MLFNYNGIIGKKAIMRPCFEKWGDEKFLTYSLWIVTLSDVHKYAGQISKALANSFASSVLHEFRPVIR